MSIELNNIDLRLKLLSGDSFFIDNVELKPLTLREIKDLGYIKYNKYLGVISLRVDELLSENDYELLKDVSLIDLILNSANEEMIDVFISALCFLLHESKDKVKYHKDYGLIFGDIKQDLKECKYVGSKNFAQLVDVIKFQNCLSNAVSDSYNPKDEKAKSIIEKLKKFKSVVSKAKKASDDDDSADIDFADLVSAVSTKSNTYNKHSVWDLTIYQFYDEYKRLEILTSYEVTTRAIIAGAKIDLKHWSSKITQ